MKLSWQLKTRLIESERSEGDAGAEDAKQANLLLARRTSNRLNRRAVEQRGQKFSVTAISVRTR
jgi:hypothetical protein